MSRKIAILADTASGLGKEYWGENTYMLPLYINFTDNSYKDMIDIDANQVFEKMEKDGIPKTSIASVGEIKGLIEKIKSDGYTDILAITISSGLSGVYNSVCMAANDEKDIINMKVIDTKNIWLGTGFLVHYAQDLLSENPDISFEEFYQKVNSSVENTRLIFSLDTLKYLIAGGRVGKVVGTFGSLLKIMPVISCDEDGVYATLAKTRSTDKAILEITGRIKEFLNNNKGKKYYIALTYKKDKELLKKFEEILKDEIAQATRYIKYETVTATIGVHSGPGVYGVGAFFY